MSTNNNWYQLTEWEAKQLVRVLCEKATGWPAAIEPLQGPEPGNQYLTVQLTSLESLQHDISMYELDADDKNMLVQNEKGESILHFRILARGAGSFNALVRLRDFMRKDNRFWDDFEELPIPERFKDVPLYKYFGLSSIDDIQNITIDLLGKIWPGAFVNIFFYANIKPYIPDESIELGGTLKNIDISTVISENGNKDTLTVHVESPYETTEEKENAK